MALNLLTYGATRRKIQSHKAYDNILVCESFLTRFVIDPPKPTQVLFDPAQFPAQPLYYTRRYTTGWNLLVSSTHHHAFV